MREKTWFGTLPIGAKFMDWRIPEKLRRACIKTAKSSATDRHTGEIVSYFTWEDVERIG